jgi:N,N'-diacetyllegionaminate synthase
LQSFVISGRSVGPSDPCFVIGEVGQNHDGSLGTVHAYIDAIADAGADAVKLQTHIAAAESTPSEPWRVKFSPQDETRYDYWQRMEFTEDQWVGMKKHAEDRGLVFLSSPFSLDALQLLSRIGIGAWKVASGEVNNTILLSAMADTGLPVLISSGMSPMTEIDAAVELVRGKGAPVGVFQCTSNYPTPPEKIGLNVIETFRKRYDCPVGLSDQTGKIFAGLAAAQVGIQMLEIHVTMTRQAFGPDIESSVTTEELTTLVKGIRYIEAINANPVDKDEMARELSGLRDLFNKSLVLTGNVSAGTVLEMRHVAAKKPGTGITVDRLDEVLGRRLNRDLASDSFLSEDDLEAPGQ